MQEKNNNMRRIKQINGSVYRAIKHMFDENNTKHKIPFERYFLYDYICWAMIIFFRLLFKIIFLSL